MPEQGTGTRASTVLLLQERAGLAQVVPQGGAERLLEAERAGGNACAGPGAGAAAGQIPSAHSELPRLLKGAWPSPAHLSFAFTLLLELQTACPVGHAAWAGYGHAKSTSTPNNSVGQEVWASVMSGCTPAEPLDLSLSMLLKGDSSLC